MKTPIWLLLAGITSLSLIFPGCDRGQEATSAPNGSWKASFRVESGELTTSQMASASWVRVAASRSGVVVAYNETFYSDHQVGLKIPDAGAVDIKLTGYNDQNKTTVMWTGTGTIANGVADPGANIVTLVAGPGLTTDSSAIPWNTSITYGTLTDSRDSKSYKTLVIGTQTWMAENLNYAGTGTTVGVCYNSRADSCAKYGRLYTWAEAMAGSTSSSASPSGVQGVCPTGWHVPSDAEWTTMQTVVDPTNTTDGTKLKSTSGWNSSGNGTDTYGFRALPGGGIVGGASDMVGSYGGWWSATEYDA